MSAVDEMNDICASDNNSYPLTSKARRVNAAHDRFFTLAFQADGKFNYDDVRHGSLPIEPIDLVSGTQDYALTDFASKVINVLRIEAILNDDSEVLLTRLDRNSVRSSLPDYRNVDGSPVEYDLMGNYIRLYPAPDYNKTGGLRLYFDRNKVAFAAGDTNVELGVPSLFEAYICNYASLPYLKETGKSNKNDVIRDIMTDEIAILDYFAHREPHKRAAPINPR